MKHEGVGKSKRQRKTAHKSQICQQFFTFLPSELKLDILSRLPARTAMICQCVCKSWFDLLTSTEFVKSHLSKSVPVLAIYNQDLGAKSYKIVEYVDELDINCDEDRWNIVCNFDLPVHKPLYGSANGLLFLEGLRPWDLIICNPITRDYIMLPFPRQSFSRSLYMPEQEACGFGVSRVSGQYKVVRVISKSKPAVPPDFKNDEMIFECQVYTIGTGSWRRIANSPLTTVIGEIGAFLNGNLHWLKTKGGFREIYCLDLETELFSTFSFPIPLDVRHWYSLLSVLGDCLCVCENLEDEINIWLMEGYGDETSWTKGFIIRRADIEDGVSLGYICPVKVFKDGGILMQCGFETSTELCFYFSKTKTIRIINMLTSPTCRFSCAAFFTPSFLSLKAFAMENVTSF